MANHTNHENIQDACNKTKIRECRQRW